MTASASEAAADSISWHDSPTAAALEDCLCAAAAGHREPFAQLYDLTAARVYGMVLQVLQDGEWAEQVTHEAYLSMWRQAAAFSPHQNSGIGWILMIAHRCAVDQLRREAPGYGGGAPQSGTRVDDQVAASAERAFARLTEPQRRLINLAYFQARTHTEIDNYLDLSPGSAAAGIRSSLTRLRGALGEPDAGHR